MTTTLLNLRTCLNGCATDAPTKRGYCNTCYQRLRTTGSITSSMVSAAVAREKIKTLVECGWNYREIADAAGMDRMMVAKIIGGQETIADKTRDALLAIEAADRFRYMVNRCGWDTRTDKPMCKGRSCPPGCGCGRHTRSGRRGLGQRAGRRPTPAPPQPKAAPVIRTVTDVRCGDCETLPCVCDRGHPATDADLALLAGLADHDRPLNFREHGLCSQVDPEIFFPEKGGSTREAKKICLGCEFRAPCLDYAIAHQERFGIWGGLSERERRAMEKGIA